jgi:hypothetical protein
MTEQTIYTFAWQKYIRDYEDLQKAGINSRESAYEHYIISGKFEDRKAMFYDINVFDWEEYVNKYSDLQKAGIDTKEKAYTHWISNGLIEGRQSFFLDTNKYQQLYKDLQDKTSPIELFTHYIVSGKKEMRLFPYY